MILIKQYFKALKALTPSGKNLFIYFNKSLVLKRKLWFSISNSPYPGHVVRRAVDVYSEFPYLPVTEGVVKDIIRIPSNNKFKCAEKDEWVIIISLPEVRNVLKILHVKPAVRKGEKLYLGDELGRFVKTYHFYPWTEPHMHLELRKASDPIRALGGYELLLGDELLSILEGLQHINEDVFVVSYIGTNYTVLKPKGGGYPCAKVSGVSGFLDGGIPHYGHASLLMPKTISVLKGENISISKHVVGKLISAGRYYAIFKPIASPIINGITRHGVGYFLMRDEVKLICNASGMDLSEGDIVNISWSIRNDIVGSKYLKLLRYFS